MLDVGAELVTVDATHRYREAVVVEAGLSGSGSTVRGRPANGANGHSIGHDLAADAAVACCGGWAARGRSR